MKIDKIVIEYTLHFGLATVPATMTNKIRSSKQVTIFDSFYQPKMLENLMGPPALYFYTYVVWWRSQKNEKFRKGKTNANAHTQIKTLCRQLLWII